MFCKFCEKEDSINLYLGGDGAPLILCPTCREKRKSTLFLPPEHNLGVSGVHRGGSYADLGEGGEVFVIVGMIKVRIKSSWVCIEDGSAEGVRVRVEAVNPDGVRDQLRIK